MVESDDEIAEIMDCVGELLASGSSLGHICASRKEPMRKDAC